MGLSIVAAAVLAACGGGGNSTTGSAAPLTGTAAVGAPLPNATVNLKDANGKTSATTADANGAYTFADVSGFAAPLMLQATGTAGGQTYTLHSVLEKIPAAGVSSVVNVTPATEVAMAQATGADPAAVFSDPVKIKAIDPAKLADAKKKLIAALANVLPALGQDSAKVDLFTTAFTANNAGLDKLLDTIDFKQEPSTTADQRAMRVADKNTGVEVAKIEVNTAPSAVVPVPRPEAETLALDTSKIKALITAFNAQTGTLAGIRSDAMRDLFDEYYFDRGKDRAAQLTSFLGDSSGYNPGLLGDLFQDYVIQGCDGEKKICQGTFTNKLANGGIEQVPWSVKQGTDGKWRIYGNQSPFGFELRPVVIAQYTITNGVAAQTLIQTGFNFYFTGKVNGTKLYNSAKVFSSVDNGGTWTEVAAFKSKAGCSNFDWLQTDDASSDCSNFKAVSDATANTNNSARMQGTARFKIAAYSDANYTTETASFNSRRLTYELLTATTGAQAIVRSGQGITPSGLGTNSVSFTGGGDQVRIGAYTNSANSGTTTWTGSSAKALNGSASIAKANTFCLTNSNPTQCDASYGSTATIGYVFLASRDAADNGIWTSYAAGSTGTSAPAQ